VNQVELFGLAHTFVGQCNQAMFKTFCRQLTQESMDTRVKVNKFYY